jgi:hypothetical protein
MKISQRSWLTISKRWEDGVGGWNLRQRCASMWSNQMRHVYPVTHDSPDLTNSLTFAQQEVLERAVTKIVLLGAQVGVSTEQMILLLESGLTVGELVQYLAARNGERC